MGRGGPASRGVHVIGRAGPDYATEGTFRGALEAAGPRATWREAVAALRGQFVPGRAETPSDFGPPRAASQALTIKIVPGYQRGERGTYMEATGGGQHATGFEGDGVADDPRGGLISRCSAQAYGPQHTARALQGGRRAAWKGAVHLRAAFRQSSREIGLGLIDLGHQATGRDYGRVKQLAQNTRARVGGLRGPRATVRRAQSGRAESTRNQLPPERSAHGCSPTSIFGWRHRLCGERPRPAGPKIVQNPLKPAYPGGLRLVVVMDPPYGDSGRPTRARLGRQGRAPRKRRFTLRRGGRWREGQP